MHRAAFLLFLLASPALSNPHDVHWSDAFALPPDGQGLNAQVLALTGWDGRLAAGGDFTDAGGLPVGYLAAWDGSSWDDLAGGTDGTVVALQAWGDSLVVGGLFTTAGGIDASNIALWDGAVWHALGSGTDDVVRALAVYEGDLYAGGSFSEAGGSEVSHIARWDGSAWHALGSGTSSRVEALTIYNGQLVAGGLFDEAGGVVANHVAAWGGKAWTPLGTGTDQRVRAIGVFEGQLVAGGGFTTAGGVDAERIATWNGATWSAVGAGFDDEVRGLTVYNGRLVAVGEFGVSGGAPVPGIARWTGAEWSGLGSGLDGPGWAVTVAAGDLWVGGGFSAVPDGSSSWIARWGDASDPTLNVPAEFLLIQDAVDSAPDVGLHSGPIFTVQVASGEYLEDVVVDCRAVEIVGAGTRKTTIGSLYYPDGCVLLGAASNLTALGDIENVSDADNLFFTDLRASSIHLIGYQIFGATRCTTDVSISGYGFDHDTHIQIVDCVSAVISIFSNGSATVETSVADHISAEGDDNGGWISDCVAETGVRAEGAGAQVLRTTVLNGGVGAIGRYQRPHAGYASVFECSVPNGAIFASSDDGVDIHENDVGLEIEVEAPSISIEGNVSSAIEATCISRRPDDTRAVSIEVAGNVVRQGGLVITGASRADYLDCSGNTLRSAGAALVVEEYPVAGFSVSNNICVGDTAGVVLGGGVGVSPVLTCNNAWSPSGSSWVGIPDPTGVDGNISADPLFCGPDEGDLTLAANSPCLPGNHPDGVDCGLIGALGKGCEAARPDLVPDLFFCLPDTAAAWHEDPDSLMVGAVVRNGGNVSSDPFDVRIEIEGCVGFWGDTQSIAGLAAGEQDTVFAGPFAVHPEPCLASVWVDHADDVDEADEGNNALLDESVCVILGTDVPGDVSAVPRVFPVPTRGALTISTGLAVSAKVEVFDGGGRLVRTLVAPGGQPITWDGHADSGRPVADGIYFVRFPGTTKRVVMLR